MSLHNGFTDPSRDDHSTLLLTHVSILNRDEQTAFIPTKLWTIRPKMDIVLKSSHLAVREDHSDLLYSQNHPQIIHLEGFLILAHELRAESTD